MKKRFERRAQSGRLKYDLRQKNVKLKKFRPTLGSSVITITISLVLGLLLGQFLPIEYLVKADAGNQMPYITNVAYKPVVETLTASAPKRSEPSQIEKNLNTLFTEWSNSHPNSGWSVVVSQIGGDNNYAEYNADKTYYLASIYKLFMVKPLQNKLAYEKWESVIADGTDKTISNCVTDMIQRSDNPCGEAIGNLAGWINAENQAKKDGLSSIDFKTTDLHGNAKDMAKFLVQLDEGTGYQENVKQQVMDAMLNQVYNQGLKKACLGCKVFNKTGDMNGVKNDVGIVEVNNLRYAIAIMSDGNSNWPQIANLSKSIISIVNN